MWKLDRLGRSLRDLVDLVAIFHEQDVNFISLHDHIDTTTATGKVLEKCGFRYKEIFDYEATSHYWFELKNMIK